MESFNEALYQIGRLKELQRSGWTRKGIEHPESVADHSFRCAIIALLCSQVEGIDTHKLLQMVLTHDLAESDPAVGDITPLDGIDPQEKHKREETAMKRLCGTLPNGDMLLNLWLEFEEGKTEEAKMARQIDTVEMALQAQEYQREYQLDLSDFIEYARARVSHPMLITFFEENS